jgi:hypothetical protein
MAERSRSSSVSSGLIAWMVLDEDTQFKGAVVAVYTASTDEAEKERIKEALDSLRDLAALLSGVPVDVERVKVPDNPLPLRNLWLEVVGR